MIDPAVLDRLLEFRRERDWEQFHNLRTLAVSIAIEAAELMELTQWTRDDELADVEENKTERIHEEVADIAILLSYLAHDLGIDLDEAIAAKLEKNRAKYPVELARGNARKYDELG